jgi:hypothetical protein
LDIKRHQSWCHVQAHQPGVQVLTVEQRREIRCVVGDKHVTVVDGTAHDRPVLARTQPKPCDMHRLLVAAFVRKRDQQRT